MYRYLIVICLACFSCTREQALITNQERLTDIRQMLEEQQQLLANSSLDLRDNIAQAATPDEKQAMEFLYAYMPLSDLGDYSAGYMLDNVRRSLQARTEMPWGKKVPEDTNADASTWKYCSLKKLFLEDICKKISSLAC